MLRARACFCVFASSLFTPPFSVFYRKIHYLTRELIVYIVLARTCFNERFSLLNVAWLNKVLLFVVVNSALNCTRKPISHESRSDECDIGFQVQFNAEFTGQVMNFP